VTAPERTFAPLAPLADDLEWQLKGSCRGLLDDATFFPERQSAAGRGKRICAECPIKGQCLDWAMAHGEPWGTWGGLTEWERAKLLNMKRRR
jgi:WhiB family transcriptional regulator, redox-sensing transcriptional regulator